MFFIAFNPALYVKINNKKIHHLRLEEVSYEM